MRSLFVGALCAAGLFAGAHTSQAALLTYELGSTSSVSASATDPGLKVFTAVYPLTGSSFQLDDGQTKSFKFFDIWTDETTVNNGEDTAHEAITATLNFTIPTIDGTVNGETFGVTGWFAHGRVEWDGPVIVNAVDRQFKITLSNENFNTGFFPNSLTEGEKCGATVCATIEQLSSLPEPASLSILAIGGAGLLLRRRRAAA